METVIQVRHPWNKGLIIGQKRPLLPRQVWSIRVRLEMSASARDLALFNVAIDSKLRASDLVRLKVDDICSGRSSGCSQSRLPTTVATCSKAERMGARTSRHDNMLASFIVGSGMSG